MSLGSFCLNAVVADVVSFLDEQDAVQCTLASPRSYAIVKCFRALRMKSLKYLRLNDYDDKILIRYSEGEEEQTFWCELDETSLVMSFLETCKSIEELSWCRVDINDEVLKVLLLINIGKMKMNDNKVYVNPQLFTKFLQRNPGSIETRSVELSNDLVTDRNMKLLQSVDIHCSRNKNKQQFENRITTISDEYLRFNWENGKKKIIFSGFITGFTVKGISQFIKTESATADLGTLKFDQLEKAKAFKEKKERSIQLNSWNGQKTLRFLSAHHNVRICYIRFWVNLTENHDGHIVDLPVSPNIVSPSSLDYFTKSIKALNSFKPDDQIGAERNNMEEIHISYKDEWQSVTKLFISCKVENSDITMQFVKTDIEENDAYLLIRKFLNTCRSARKLRWDRVTMEEDFLQFLEQISNRITVYNSSIHGLYYNEWLTDRWLISFFNKGQIPEDFSAQGLNRVTANGMRIILKELETKSDQDFSFDMGTINDDNAGDVKKMMKEIAAENDGPWNIKRTKYHFSIFDLRNFVIKRKETETGPNIEIAFNFLKSDNVDDNDEIDISAISEDGSDIDEENSDEEDLDQEDLDEEDSGPDDSDSDDMDEDDED